MKSSTIIKSRSPKSNISNMGGGRAKNYLNKNLQKKYIYKKEKAIDTDKVLQNNKISKNLVFSPTYKKGNNGIKYKNILNNSNSDLRRGIEIRDDVNIDYEQYQQQINNVTISNYNPIINNSNMMNQSFFVMSKKNGYLTNSNRDNKWKCTKCGNVNSNFNFLCNNCNMPNNSLDQNSSLIVNQRSGSTGKTIEAIGLDNNLINSSFNNSFNNNSFNNNSFNNNSFNNNSFNNNINNSSQNLLSKSINNSVIKKQFLRKNNTNNNLKTLTSNSNYSTNNLLGPYYSNVDYRSIRNKNKNNNNYFYSCGNKTNDNQNTIINSNNAYETERDNNITQLYSYSNYLVNELKSSNDTNAKLLENYQNNESEYNNNYQQNDLIIKKIKSLKEKENQLEKVNEQLQTSLSYIKEKLNDKNIEDQDGGMIRAIFNDSDFDLSEFKSKIKELTEENEKLSDKLKENKNIIIKLKTKIGELSDDKKTKNFLNNNNNNKSQNTALIKDKINQYIGDIKEQNQQYNKLDNENRIMEQKIKLLKKQIEDEEKNNIINKNININENNKNKTINSVSINNNNDTMEREKDIYLKTKEKNNKLAQFIEELHKVKDNKDKNNNKNKIYNMDEKYLMEMLNVEGENNEEKEMMDCISDYLNLLNDKTD